MTWRGLKSFNISSLKNAPKRWSIIATKTERMKMMIICDFSIEKVIEKYFTFFAFFIIFFRHTQPQIHTQHKQISNVIHIDLCWLNNALSHTLNVRSNSERWCEESKENNFIESCWFWNECMYIEKLLFLFVLPMTTMRDERKTTLA